MKRRKRRRIVFREPDQSLRDAKRMVKERALEGITCPCCNQLAKIYVRQINDKNVRFLMNLVRLGRYEEGGWVHFKRCMVGNSRDYGFLANFGLAETAVNFDTTKKASGYWRTTEDGILFVNDELCIPKKIKVYDNHVLWRSKILVDVHHCLGKKFDYEELMRSR